MKSNPRMRPLYADKPLPLGRTGPIGFIVGGRLAAMVWWIAGIVLSGCSSESVDSGAMNPGGLEPTPVDTVPVSPVLVDTDTLTEALQACDVAQPIRAHQYLCLREGSLTWVDEVSGTTGLMVKTRMSRPSAISTTTLKLYMADDTVRRASSQRTLVRMIRTDDSEGINFRGGETVVSHGVEPR